MLLQYGHKNQISLKRCLTSIFSLQYNWNPNKTELFNYYHAMYEFSSNYDVFNHIHNVIQFLKTTSISNKFHL